MGLYLWLIISMLTPFLLKKQVVLNWKAGSDKIRIHCKQVFFLLGVWCESLQEMHLFMRVRQRERGHVQRRWSVFLPLRIYFLFTFHLGARFCAE